jgi:hypothetical protein
MKQTNKELLAIHSDIGRKKFLLAPKAPQSQLDLLDDELLIRIAHSRKGGPTIRVELKNL